MKKIQGKIVSVIILLIYIISIFGPHIYGMNVILGENNVENPVYEEEENLVDDLVEDVPEEENVENKDIEGADQEENTDNNVEENTIEDENENNQVEGNTIEDEAIKQEGNTTKDETTKQEETNTTLDKKDENSANVEIETSGIGTLASDIVTVTNETELVAAIADSSVNIVIIGNDIILTSALLITRSISFMAESQKIIYAPSSRHMNITGNDITMGFANVVLDGANYSNGGIINQGTNTTLTDIVIQKCYNPNGAAINNTGSLTINGNSKIISNNSSNSYGGGIYNSGNLIINDNVEISNNTVSLYGGGIYQDNGALQINDNVKITQNKATSSYSSGGGIYSHNDLSSIVINGNVQISGNTAANGGGIYKNGSLQVGNGVVFSNNIASAGYFYLLDEDIANYNANILAINFSINPYEGTQSQYGYNNYDISYKPTYTILYNGNGNTSGMKYTRETYKSEVIVSVEEIPGLEKTGYTFMGWRTNNGTEYKAGDIITLSAGVTVLNAIWGHDTAGDTYTITLDYQEVGNNLKETKSVRYGEAVGTLPNPTKAGYIFKGWNTKPDGTGTEYTEEKIYLINDDITLYAIWGVYITNESELQSAVSNENINIITIGNDITISNNLFITRSIKFVGDSQVKIYAPSSRHVYLYGYSVTLEFENVILDGNGSRGGIYNGYGSSITLKDVVLQNCYNNAGGAIYNESTLIIKGNSKIINNIAGTGGGIYNLSGLGSGTGAGTFSLIGLTSIVILENNTQISGNEATNGGGIYNSIGKIILNDKVKISGNTAAQNGGGIYNEANFSSLQIGNGVVFSDNTAGQGYNYILPADIDTHNQYVLATNFSVNPYEGIPSEYGYNNYDISYKKTSALVYRGNGNISGKPPSSEAYEADTQATIKGKGTLTKPGYDFKGWSSTTNNIVEYLEGEQITVSTGVKILYAVWERNSNDLYEMTFDYQGGETGNTEIIREVAYTEEVGTLPNPGRIGYTFNGWNTQPDGQGTYYTDTTVYMVAGNTTLYAIWEPDIYEIMFEYQGAETGDTEVTRQVAYGSPIGTLPNPGKTAHTLTGWNTKSDGTGTYYTDTTPYLVLGDTTLYAVWEINKYQITFNYQGAEAGNTETTRIIEYGSQVGVLPVPGKIGHTFKGWNIEPDGQGIYYTGTTSYTELDDITLYAIWEANKYEIEFNYQGANTENTEVKREVTYGSPVGILPNPGKTGYTFKGWNAEPNGHGTEYTELTPYMVADNVTLYAIWEANKYEIEFNYQGADAGNTETTRQVAYESQIGVLPNPGKTGYTFKGWNTNSDGQGTYYTETTTYLKLSNITLYAIWEANKYQITFNYQGANTGNTEATRQVTFETQVGALPAPGKTGHTFKGWNTDPDGQGTSYANTTIYMVAGDTTLYAVWEANKYEITFDYQGAEVGNTEVTRQIVYGSLVGTLPNPEKTGYTFKRWNTTSNGIGVDYTESTQYMVAGNLTLYAIWEANKYEIEFNYQGADTQNTEATRQVTYGSPVGALPAPGKTGYTLIGWNTEVNGQGLYYAQTTPYMVAGSLTLYAIWEANKYQITFDYQGANAGNTEATRQVIYDETVGILPNPGKTGYTFRGWNTSLDGTGTGYIDTTVYTVPGDLTLYAIWEANKYQITFDYQGANTGNTETTRQVSYASPVGALPAPGKTGYGLIGWNTEPNGTGMYYGEITPYMIAGNLELYAIWEANKYQIAFDYQGANTGNTETTRHVSYENQVGILPDPGKTGYTFKGWNTAADEQGAYYTETTTYLELNNITLYAIWEANKYQITFNYQGANTGNTEATRQVTFGTQVGALSNPGKTGYTFNGWNTQPDGQGTYYTGTTTYMIAEDLTLYAIWEANKYEIIFNYQGASSQNTEATRQVSYESQIGALPIPKKTGHTFMGWNTHSDGQGVYYTETTTYLELNNITLYAIWEVNKYEITFDYQGAESGNTEATRQVTFGTQVGVLPTPGKTGYTFKGWNTATDGKGTYYTEVTAYMVEGDVTLYTIWEANKYEIIFEYQGAEAEDTVTSKQVSYENQVGELPRPLRRGYTLIGWNTEPNGQGMFYTGTTTYRELNNITLYAIWEINTYEITFNYQGAQIGNTEGTRFIIYGTDVGILPVPARIGYRFIGWNSEPNGQGKYYTEITAYTVEGDITLYAIWEANRYEVSFEYQGADVGYSESMRQVAFESKIGELPKPVRKGYKLVGWNSEPDGQGMFYTATTIYRELDNITLYAIWEEYIAYEITFDYQGADTGTIETKREVEYGTAIGTLPNPGKTGYTFKGWCKDPNGNGVYYTNTTVYLAQEDIILYAIWEEKALPEGGGTSNNNSVPASGIDFKQILYGGKLGGGINIQILQLLLAIMLMSLGVVLLLKKKNKRNSKKK